MQILAIPLFLSHSNSKRITFSADKISIAIAIVAVIKSNDFALVYRLQSLERERQTIFQQAKIFPLFFTFYVW